MNAFSLLHEEITHACPQIHKVRLNTLMHATEALCLHQRATLTGLGRTLSSKVNTRYCIKRMDRLLGNTKLHQERTGIYQTMAAQLIGAEKTPLILVDWSQINEESGFHILRASLPMGGRSLTLYEEVHPKKNYNTPAVHTHFLTTLKTVLPTEVTPIIVTDAGFKNPWFNAVAALGWYWVGRVRNKTLYRIDNESSWIPCSTLYPHATTTPGSVGAIILAKGNPLNCYAHLYHKSPLGRKKRTQGKRVSKRSNSTTYGRREREPWLLVSNLPLTSLSSQGIVSIYRTRMQIEESFRDNKNQRIGLSLKETKSRNEQRLQILLLIVALASLLLWLIGKAATQQKLHPHYQANTVTTKTILSLFNLGLQVLRKAPESLPLKVIENIFEHLATYAMKIKLV